LLSSLRYRSAMRSSQQVAKLAPILQALRHPSPDWKAIAFQLFAYLNLEDLPIKGKQDWKAISQYLIGHLNDHDAHYQRVNLILGCLSRHPKDFDQLAGETGLGRNTVQQTVLALIKGSYEIYEQTSPGLEGRPRKAFWVE
jgi:hypothetical protein